MTPDMLAALAVTDMLAALRAEAAERKRQNVGRPPKGKEIPAGPEGIIESGEAVEIAARRVGTSKDKVRQAEALKEEAPGLLALLGRGSGHSAALGERSPAPQPNPAAGVDERSGRLTRRRRTRGRQAGRRRPASPPRLRPGR